MPCPTCPHATKGVQGAGALASLHLLRGGVQGDAGPLVRASLVQPGQHRRTAERNRRPVDITVTRAGQQFMSSGQFDFVCSSRTYDVPPRGPSVRVRGSTESRNHPYPPFLSPRFCGPDLPCHRPPEQFGRLRASVAASQPASQPACQSNGHARRQASRAHQPARVWPRC